MCACVCIYKRKKERELEREKGKRIKEAGGERTAGNAMFSHLVAR